MFGFNKKLRKGSIVMSKDKKQACIVSLVSDNGDYVFIDTDSWFLETMIIKYCKIVAVEDLIIIKR